MSRHNSYESQSYISSLMRSVTVSLLTLMIVVALIAGGIYLGTNKGSDIDDHSWLVLDLYGSISEYDTPGGPLAMVSGGGGLTLQDMLDNLGKAALDDRIEGVIFHISASNSAGWAKLEELRLAVDKVQAAGKPVHAWADVLDLKSLYLASGCDDVLMPDGGYFSLTGMSAGMPFVGGVLAKLGIIPHLHKIKDYKSAAELIMNTEMSDYAREMRSWMLDEVWEMVIPAIARERGLTEEKIIELMSYAEFQPSEALEAGLITETIYMQELEDRLKGEDDDILKIVTHDEYTKESWEDVGLKTGPVVAVVHAQGNIGGRDNRVDPIMGVMMGHESIIRELQRCRLDDEVEAVVLRIDSGGGESLASDLMAHEVGLLAKVKPVVISMVDVAASGGYYMAYKGSYLMADPLTVTGSIGSINGFFNMSGFYEKIGFNKESVTRGPMASLGTDMREPTEEEWARHTDAHWKSFNAWLADVARHRGLEFEDAEKLAHGRVWSGRQAIANGLIDGLGNLDAAVAQALLLAEVKEEKAARILHLPEKQNLIDSILSSDENPNDPVAAAVQAAIYREVQLQTRQTVDFLQRGAANVVVLPH